MSNVEFSELPICTASKEYQEQKLHEIEKMDLGLQQKEKIIETVLEKACICDHLGNGALIALGLARETLAPQSICPGPNIAWFDRVYTLEEMIDHIYGRGKSLVSEYRPHMYAKEIRMYLTWVGGLMDSAKEDAKQNVRLKKILLSLVEGVEYCAKVAQSKAHIGENLASLVTECQKALNEISEMEAQLA